MAGRWAPFPTSNKESIGGSSSCTPLAEVQVSNSPLSSPSPGPPATGLEGPAALEGPTTCTALEGPATGLEGELGDSSGKRDSSLITVDLGKQVEVVACRCGAGPTISRSGLEPVRESDFNCPRLLEGIEDGQLPRLILSLRALHGADARPTVGQLSS